MSKRPWFPLYVGDILADTMNFDSAQFGGYMKILCHYWVTEEPMTMDEMRVASGLSKNIFQKSWPLFSKKFVTENEKYFNRRMKDEIIKAIEISEKRAVAGSKGGQASASDLLPQLPTQSQSQLHKDKEKHTSAASPPTCPHEQIIDIYHETLPTMPRILLPRWKGSPSEKNLRARWREDEHHQDLDFWREFFTAVTTNKWWMEEWGKADLHWLLKRANFDKVLNHWNNAGMAA